MTVVARVIQLSMEWVDGMEGHILTGQRTGTRWTQQNRKALKSGWNYSSKEWAIWSQITPYRSPTDTGATMLPLPFFSAKIDSSCDCVFCHYPIVQPLIYVNSFRAEHLPGSVFHILVSSCPWLLVHFPHSLDNSLRFNASLWTRSEQSNFYVPMSLLPSPHLPWSTSLDTSSAGWRKSSHELLSGSFGSHEIHIWRS